MSLIFSTSTFAATGYVKWYNTTKGYGFITPFDVEVTEGKDTNVFVEKQDLEAAEIEDLEDGQCVTFDVVKVNENFFTAENLLFCN
jgi:cold shock CspA family protein